MNRNCLSSGVVKRSKIDTFDIIYNIARKHNNYNILYYNNVLSRRRFFF